MTVPAQMQPVAIAWNACIDLRSRQGTETLNVPVDGMLTFLALGAAVFLGLGDAFVATAFLGAIAALVAGSRELEQMWGERRYRNGRWFA